MRVPSWQWDFTSASHYWLSARVLSSYTFNFECARYSPPLPRFQAADEYRAGLELVIDRGWLWLHESGTYIKFTQAGADLFDSWRDAERVRQYNEGLAIISGSARPPIALINVLRLKPVSPSTTAHNYRYIGHV